MQRNVNRNQIPSWPADNQEFWSWRRQWQSVVKFKVRNYKLLYNRFFNSSRYLKPFTFKLKSKELSFYFFFLFFILQLSMHPGFSIKTGGLSSIFYSIYLYINVLVLFELQIFTTVSLNFLRFWLLRGTPHPKPTAILSEFSYNSPFQSMYIHTKTTYATITL